MARATFPDPKPPFYRDTRTIAVLVQLVFLGVLLAAGFCTTT
jgi:hypothetical protein